MRRIQYACWSCRHCPCATCNAYAVTRNPAVLTLYAGAVLSTYALSVLLHFSLTTARKLRHLTEVSSAYVAFVPDVKNWIVWQQSSKKMMKRYRYWMYLYWWLLQLNSVVQRQDSHVHRNEDVFYARKPTRGFGKKRIHKPVQKNRAWAISASFYEGRRGNVIKQLPFSLLLVGRSFAYIGCKTTSTIF